jgi:hypothetical protein
MRVPPAAQHQAGFQSGGHHGDTGATQQIDDGHGLQIFEAVGQWYQYAGHVVLLLKY